jgi:hypothetical protein
MVGPDAPRCLTSCAWRPRGAWRRPSSTHGVRGVHAPEPVSASGCAAAQPHSRRAGRKPRAGRDDLGRPSLTAGEEPSVRSRGRGGRRDARAAGGRRAAIRAAAGCVVDAAARRLYDIAGVIVHVCLRWRSKLLNLVLLLIVSIFAMNTQSNSSRLRSLSLMGCLDSNAVSAGDGADPSVAAADPVVLHDQAYKPASGTRLGHLLRRRPACPCAAHAILDRRRTLPATAP